MPVEGEKGGEHCQSVQHKLEPGDVRAPLQLPSGIPPLGKRPHQLRRAKVLTATKTLLRAAGNRAVTTSMRALKSSESTLSNAGSSVKVGTFLDDVKPLEIKVSKPEFLEMLNFASTKFAFSKANQRK